MELFCLVLGIVIIVGIVFANNKDDVNEIDLDGIE